MEKYYEINAKKYIEETIECDMSKQYQLFLKYMNNTGKILDIGFGSGRDMMYFSSIGYNVKGIDPTPSFVNTMKDNGYDVSLLHSEDMEYQNEFDGIWACASLLHVHRDNLKEVFKRCCNALKNNGIIYCSFKYGDFEGIINERYFTYLNEQLFNEIIQDTGLTILETSITGDVRSDRASEQWLNVVMKKATIITGF